MDGLSVGGYDSIGFLASPGNALAIGGYRAAQWSALEFYAAGALQATLNSTGLGIGTTSPSARLQSAVSRTSGTNTTALILSDNVTGAQTSGFGTQIQGWSNNGSAVSAIGFEASGGTNNDTGIGFYTQQTAGGLTRRMTIDASGNLGLGVTPSAWGSGRRVLQIGTSPYIMGSGTSLEFLANAYYNGTNWIYNSNGAAAEFALNAGAFYWYSASSGTAGNTATLTNTMVLDASGNLGVGATSPSTTLTVSGGNTAARGQVTVVGASADARISLYRDSTFHATFSGGSTDSYIGTESNTPFRFLTNGTERARISAGGFFKASNTGSYINSSGPFYEFTSNDVSANQSFIFYNNSASIAQQAMVFFGANRNTTNNTFYYLGCYNYQTSTYKLLVADSGDVTNTNGTYGTISDVKMKTDIVDVGSQWSDIKAVRFRKFKMKDDPSGLVQLGVVAQELEQTSPGLVAEHADRDAEGNDLGTTTKSVKTSVLLMKAAVALQEAMTRIEQLEAKVAAMESK